MANYRNYYCTYRYRSRDNRYANIASLNGYACSGQAVAFDKPVINEAP